jgi:hypothetical protein
MIKFNQSTLTEIAGLGAGAVAGAYVSQKVLTKTDEAGVVTYLVGSGTTGKLIADLAPIAVGLLLQGQSNLFAKEAGKGMIAQAAGSFIKSKFPTLGISGDGYDSPVMMAGNDCGVDDPMISNISGYDMEAPTNDFTYGDAGEMNY